MLRPIIDLDAGPCYKGLGDACIMMWLHPHVAFTTESSTKKELLSLFGIETTELKGISVSDAYNAEINDRGQKNRLEYVQHFLGIDVVPQRPTFTNPQNDWVDHHLTKLGSYGRMPKVMLCPQTCWPIRAWHPANWCFLEKQLMRRRIKPIVFLDQLEQVYVGDMARKQGCRFVFYNRPISDLVCMMSRMQMVVGPDSAPNHIAMALGVPCLCLVGPTTPSSFMGHSRDTCGTLGSGILPCISCHYSESKGCNDTCLIQCRSLLTLTAEDVLSKILSCFPQLA